ncbi:opticin [Parus major]|uniref:opticin n=1 Tax=Parus major TaxID=9157 RepID=UPI0014449ADB|nr:opticin [Parus major]
MCPLGWLGVASLCLGTLWAVPAKERRKAEKPKADLTLYENPDLDNYDLTLDNYGEILDLSNYEELYDYGDLVPKIEVGTLAPRPKDPKTHPELGETTAGTPKPQPPSGAGPAPPAPIPGQGLPSCLLCLCLGTSVYCDDADLEQIPALPPDTAYLYARFNRIAAIRARDFSGLGASRSAGPTGKIPPGRVRVEQLKIRNNNIQTMHEDTFCDSQDQGQIRRALEDIRLDGNPINLSLFPNAFFCLPRLPTGRFS